MNTTQQQALNLDREIQQRKDDARRRLVGAFWYTRTKSQLLAYDRPEPTPEYTLPLPEFQEFVRELVNHDDA